MTSSTCSPGDDMGYGDDYAGARGARSSEAARTSWAAGPAATALFAGPAWDLCSGGPAGLTSALRGRAVRPR